MKISNSVALIFLLNFIFNNILGQNLNNLCQTSFPYCTEITYNSPAGTNTGSAQTGPDYGCLLSQLNPAWYYLQVDQSGNFAIDIHSNPSFDIDFICWGPFTDATSPCISDLTAQNTIDCSYNSSYQEWCVIPNAQLGEFYILLITNYSNEICNIIFNQYNAGQPGEGSSVCGPVASINGNIFLDSNNNGIKDSTENGLFGGFVLAPSCGYYTQSDSSGNFNTYICSTPDTIWPFYNNYPYVNSISPPFYTVSGNTNNKDFAITLTPNIFDVSAIFTGYSLARPGFDYLSRVTLSNIGTEQSCGTLTLTYDSIFDYISTNPPADLISGNILTWNNICLPLFQNRNFDIELHLDSTIAISTPYSLFADFNSTQNDTNLFNNRDTISGVVINSMDPNKKEVNPDGIIANSTAEAQQELEYTIHFQNTGTASAINIKIIDTLSEWLQIPTFNFLSSSHLCTYNISEHGKVQFIFNDINLPSIDSNETESNGFIKFKVKCRPELANGGNVYNKAYIYFDSNQPIVTNTTLTYTNPLVSYIPLIKKPVLKNITLEPNPATEFVNVKVNYNGRETLNIEILDVQGRSINKQPLLPGQKTALLNISKMGAGAYMIRISGKDFSAAEPLIVH